MTIRIAMWSGPRNISTAMMRSFENRPDTSVVDEPFYAAYLFETGLDHPLREAVLGGAVLVPTPSGALRVTLPAGSDTGRQIRLRGKGVAEHGTRAAGDLFLTLRVVIGPSDAALEEFLRGWTPEHPSDPRAGLEGAA